jgi:hypothetical protein
MPLPTRGLGGVITACWAKPCRAISHGEKMRFREGGRLWTILSLQTDTLLDVKHLHNAWVSGVAFGVFDPFK